MRRCTIYADGGQNPEFKGTHLDDVSRPEALTAPTDWLIEPPNSKKAPVVRLASRKPAKVPLVATAKKAKPTDPAVDRSQRSHLDDQETGRRNAETASRTLEKPRSSKTALYRGRIYSSLRHPRRFMWTSSKGRTAPVMNVLRLAGSRSNASCSLRCRVRYRTAPLPIPASSTARPLSCQWNFASLASPDGDWMTIAKGTTDAASPRPSERRVSRRRTWRWSSRRLALAGDPGIGGAQALVDLRDWRGQFAQRNDLRRGGCRGSARRRSGRRRDRDHRRRRHSKKLLAMANPDISRSHSLE